MNRCKGLNSNNNKICRKIIDNDKIFCCKDHTPINEDVLETPCIICSEYFNANELKILKCNHAFHKKCINEYFDSIINEFNIIINNNKILICPLCNTNIKEIKKKTFKNKFNFEYNSDFNHILYINSYKCKMYYNPEN